MKIPARKVHTSKVCCGGLNSLGNLIRGGERVYRALYVFIKGYEVNYKSEFSVHLWDKARRSTEFRLFIGLHPPYNPLRFQLTNHSPCLGFNVHWNQSGSETVQRQVTGSIWGIFDRDTHRRGSQITVVGKGLREQIPELENKVSLKFSFLSYELLFVNIRANISTIGIIITIIIRLTLWRSVDQQGGQSLFTKPFSGKMCSELIA